MMASAREDKFNLKSKKTKNRMIKRAPHVKIITEITWEQRWNELGGRK